MEYKTKRVLAKTIFQEVVEASIVEISAEHNLIVVYDQGERSRELVRPRKLFFYDLKSKELVKIISGLEYYPTKIIFHTTKPLVLIYCRTETHPSSVTRPEILIYNFELDAVNSYYQFSPKLFKNKFNESYIQPTYFKEEFINLEEWILENPEFDYCHKIYKELRPDPYDKAVEYSTGKPVVKKVNRDKFEFIKSTFKVKSNEEHILFIEKKVSYCSRRKWKELATPNGSQLEQLSTGHPFPFRYMHRKLLSSALTIDKDCVALGYAKGLIEIVNLAEMTRTSVQLPTPIDRLKLLNVTPENCLLVYGKARVIRKNLKAMTDFLYKVCLETSDIEELKKGDFRVSSVNGSHILLRQVTSPHRDNDKKKGVIISSVSGKLSALNFDLDPYYYRPFLEANHLKYLYELNIYQNDNKDWIISIVEINPVTKDIRPIIEFLCYLYQIGPHGVIIDEYFFFNGSKGETYDSPMIFAFKEGENLLWEKEMDTYVWGMTSYMGTQKLLVVALLKIEWELHFIDPLTGDTIDIVVLKLCKHYHRITLLKQVNSSLLIGLDDGSVELLEVFKYKL